MKSRQCYFNWGHHSPVTAKELCGSESFKAQVSWSDSTSAGPNFTGPEPHVPSLCEFGALPRPVKFLLVPKALVLHEACHLGLALP